MALREDYMLKNGLKSRHVLETSRPVDLLKSKNFGALFERKLSVETATNVKLYTLLKCEKEWAKKEPLKTRYDGSEGASPVQRTTGRVVSLLMPDETAEWTTVLDINASQVLANEDFLWRHQRARDRGVQSADMERRTLDRSALSEFIDGPHAAIDDRQEGWLIPDIKNSPGSISSNTSHAVGSTQDIDRSVCEPTRARDDIGVLTSSQSFIAPGFAITSSPKNKGSRSETGARPTPRLMSLERNHERSADLSSLLLLTAHKRESRPVKEFTFYNSESSGHDSEIYPSSAKAIAQWGDNKGEELSGNEDSAYLSDIISVSSYQSRNSKGRKRSLSTSIARTTPRQPRSRSNSGSSQRTLFRNAVNSNVLGPPAFTTLLRLSEDECENDADAEMESPPGGSTLRTTKKQPKVIHPQEEVKDLHHAIVTLVATDTEKRPSSSIPPRPPIHRNASSLRSVTTPASPAPVNASVILIWKDENAGRSSANPNVDGAFLMGDVLDTSEVSLVDSDHIRDLEIGYSSATSKDDVAASEMRRIDNI